MPPEAVAVDPDNAGAKHAVEFDRDALAQVGFWNVKRSPIPADAVFGMIGPDGVKAVLAKLLVTFGIKRQLDRPVVRKIDFAPRTIVERWIGRPAPLAGFHQGAIAREIEIFGSIRGVTERKTPVSIKG